MKKRYAGFILFIAVPVMISVLGILFFQVYLRSAITNYIENSLEEKIDSHLDQASDDLLDVNLQKLKFNTFPFIILTPEISLYAATDVYNEDVSAMLITYVYDAGVINLEISLKPLVLISLGQKKFNINCLQADSVYFITKCLSKEAGVVINSRLENQNSRFF